jgi:hypothetical protein
MDSRMDVLGSVIESCYIERNESLNFPECVREQSRNFSLLKIKTKKVSMTKSPTFLVFTIDKTGSMLDYGGSSGSKLDYVKHTFKNMLRYLANIQDAEIYIRVHAFDETVTTLIDNIRVTTHNVAELIEQIDNLVADGMTSIESALNAANNAIATYTQNHPDHQIGHVFMTDGEASFGEMDETVLSNMVNDSFVNIFVGFGSGHNVSLLRKLSDRKRGDYQYVDNPESTVLIYGETIHQFLYPAIRNARICVRNGLLYDWQTNTWKSEIEEDVIIGDFEKIYHVKEAEDSLYDTEVDVYGQDASNRVSFSVGTQDASNRVSFSVGTQDASNQDASQDATKGTEVLLTTGYSIPNLLNFGGGIITNRDFTSYIFRQKVLELMFNAKRNDMTFHEKRNFKKELKEFFREMRLYMRETNRMDDALMRTLCDDISIVYNTLGKRDGLMFTMARQSSHGKQKVFTPTSSNNRNQTIFRTYATDEFDSPPMTPRRKPPQALPRRRLSTIKPLTLPPPIFPIMADEDVAEDKEEEHYASDDDIERYNVNDTNESCYSTASVMSTVNTMSQPPSLL